MSKQTYTIYLIEDHRMKPYVGVTSKTLEERLRKHKNKARRGVETHLYNAMRQYGAENFDIIPLDAAPTKGKAFELEKEWIERLGTCEHGYNMTKGGEGRENKGKDNPMWGKSHSDETRLKMSETHTGKTFSGGARRKMSRSTRGEKAPKVKLTCQQAAEIKWLAKKGNRTQREIGNKYGICRSTVSNIKNEERWSHVDPQKPE
jgi:group I intron endonuclease